MTAFTIDPDNNITALVEVPTGTDRSTTFSSEKELAKLIADWPISRLIDAWNSFAGVAPFDDLKPIKKFTSRKAAVVRIWKAVARLSPDRAQQGQTAAPAKGKAKKSPANAKRRDAKRPGAKGGAREGSKKAEVLELMRRKQGVTLEAIMKATGWQAHTIRGFVSGTLVKKLGLKVESFRSEDKERTYRVKP